MKKYIIDAIEEGKNEFVRAHGIRPTVLRVGKIISQVLNEALGFQGSLTRMSNLNVENDHHDPYCLSLEAQEPTYDGVTITTTNTSSRYGYDFEADRLVAVAENNRVVPANENDLNNVI